MADGSSSSQAEQGRRINIDEERDVQYWAERLCCTEEELRRATIVAGVSVMSVQQLLSRS
jgi:hypothetical protein